MGLCHNPCEFDNVCGIGANCHPKKQRPMCSCPAGYDGDPAVKCSPKICKILKICKIIIYNHVSDTIYYEITLFLHFFYLN